MNVCVDTWVDSHQNGIGGHFVSLNLALLLDFSFNFFFFLAKSMWYLFNQGNEKNTTCSSIE